MRFTIRPHKFTERLRDVRLEIIISNFDVVLLYTCIAAGYILHLFNSVCIKGHMHWLTLHPLGYSFTDVYPCRESNFLESPFEFQVFPAQCRSFLCYTWKIVTKFMDIV